YHSPFYHQTGNCWYLSQLLTQKESDLIKKRSLIQNRAFLHRLLRGTTSQRRIFADTELQLPLFFSQSYSGNLRFSD
ncbi:hypothetical protein, partial [Methylicorpusculum sp.]|uniref:hypothetical protein n=1 Tax=Methylicorpusculum sp. TaxID=2713644 RepID=UPI002ABBC668